MSPMGIEALVMSSPEGRRMPFGFSAKMRGSNQDVMLTESHYFKEKHPCSPQNSKRSLLTKSRKVFLVEKRWKSVVGALGSIKRTCLFCPSNPPRRVQQIMD